MKKSMLLSISLLAGTVGLQAAETAQERLHDAAEVLREIMSTPDRGIPQDLLHRAACVAIVPGMKKGAFIVGAEYGKGFVICRQEHEMGWRAPAAIRVEGGSFGFQIGGESTDVVMLIMNERGMHELEKDKITLGGDASIAAGPVGRTAAADTDALMNAEILSWSRNKGIFAGISLNGATLRPDRDDNRQLYGQSMGTREVFDSTIQVPEAARPLIQELDRYSMRRQG